MSHVDEGVLHAYLDGALDALAEAGELPDGASAADVLTHLTVCADCRSRLEAERAMREAAGLLLRDVALSHVDVPPFTAMGSARRTRRWLPLSWAASVLLAVGAGWWGSEAWRAQPASFATGDGAAHESAAISGVAPGGQTGTGASPAEDMGSARAADRSIPQAARSETSRSETMIANAPPPPAPSAGAGQPAAPSAATEQAAAPAQQSAAAEPLITRVEPLPAAAALEPQSAEPIGNVLAERSAAVSETRDPAVDSAQRARIVAASEPAGTPLSFAPGARAPGMPLTDSQIVSEADADAGGIAPAAFETILARERSGLIQFAPPGTAAGSRDSAQVYILADATGTSWAFAREIGQTTVRIRQTLPTGVAVEMVSWRPVAIALDALVVTSDARVRADNPPADDRAGGRSARELEQKVAESGAWTAAGPVRRLEDGRREIIVHAGGSQWLAIRADLSEEALRELVSRLRRPEPATR